MNNTKALAALERMMKDGAGEMGVGLAMVAGAGLRVVLQLDDFVMHMSPAAARRLARDFETPGAMEADLGGIATWLRDAADKHEAATGTRH